LIRNAIAEVAVKNELMVEQLMRVLYNVRLSRVGGGRRIEV